MNYFIKNGNSAVVGRIRFARPDNLHGMIFVGSQLLKSFHIMKKEISSFITVKRLAKTIVKIFSS